MKKCLHGVTKDVFSKAKKWFKQNENRKKEYLQRAEAIIAVIGLYSLFFAFNITCPIKYLTGISCAGCGMTRAWMAVFRFDFESAFYYHPGFFLVPIAVFLFFTKRKIEKVKYYRFMLTLFVVFAIIFLVRMLFFRNDIVAFEPFDGLVFKILAQIQKFIKGK